jgi:membrane-associated protein
MELLFQTQNLVAWGGIALILLLIYAETGLLLGLVIPGGETLIFTAGFLTSTGTLNISILPFFILLMMAGFLGDASGYYIGKKLGPKLYKKEDTWYFKKSYLLLTQDYVARHKKRAIIVGKFFPVIRPFIPMLSGITQLKWPTFLVLSFCSVLLYMSTFLFAGYFLGSRFPGLKAYLGWILPASVLLLLIPVLLQIRKNRRPLTSKKLTPGNERQNISGS